MQAFRTENGTYIGVCNVRITVQDIFMLVVCIFVIEFETKVELPDTLINLAIRVLVLAFPIMVLLCTNTLDIA